MKALLWLVVFGWSVNVLAAENAEVTRLTKSLEEQRRRVEWLENSAAEGEARTRALEALASAQRLELGKLQERVTTFRNAVAWAKGEKEFQEILSEAHQFKNQALLSEVARLRAENDRLRGRSELQGLILGIEPSEQPLTEDDFSWLSSENAAGDAVSVDRSPGAEQTDTESFPPWLEAFFEPAASPADDDLA